MLNALHHLKEFSTEKMSTLFSIFFFFHNFSSHNISGKFSQNFHMFLTQKLFFFCLSHHGTVSRAKFPSFLSLMMMGSSSSLPLFNIVPHTAPPAPPKSKRDWKNDSTALLMDLFEEKFLANSMNSLTQQQWQEILLKIEEAFPLTPPRTWAQVQSKVHIVD